MIEQLLQIIGTYIIGHYTQWLIILGSIIAGHFVIKLVNKWVSKLFDKVDFDRTIELFLMKMIKIILWPIWIMIILSIQGIDVTVFIAGLSIMGFVIGFATKDTLSNLVSGLFILINKPFRVGEEVDIVKIKGKVREMGISTCIVVTENNDYVTIPNSKIWGNPIINFSRLKKPGKRKSSSKK